MSKEAIPLKTYIFPPYQLLFGAGFFATYPTVLPYPAQDDVLSEHNLKSAGRFHRHCVRFLWRHKTLIDIKPRGYFNFLRLHPPGSPSHPFSCSPRLVLYDSPDMYTNPLCLSSPKILGYPLPLLISRTMHSPGFYTTDPHFFSILSDSLPLLIVKNRFRRVLQRYFQRRFLTILSIRQRRLRYIFFNLKHSFTTHAIATYS